MNLEKYIRDLEFSVDRLPRLLSGWQALPEAIRDGFFEELSGMLARRPRAEREALSRGRGDMALRLAELYGRLLMAVAEFGANAGVRTDDVISERVDLSVIVGAATPDELAIAA